MMNRKIVYVMILFAVIVIGLGSIVYGNSIAGNESAEYCFDNGYRGVRYDIELDSSYCYSITRSGELIKDYTVPEVDKSLRAYVLITAGILLNISALVLLFRLVEK